MVGRALKTTHNLESLSGQQHQKIKDMVMTGGAHFVSSLVMSQEKVHITNTWAMHKVSACLLPRLLTSDQKRKR